MLSILSLQAKKVDITQTRYDIEGVNTGTQGNFLVKVYIYTNKGEATTEQLKYAAVHGVLFRGFSGKGFAPKGIEKICFLLFDFWSCQCFLVGKTFSRESSK